MVIKINCNNNKHYITSNIGLVIIVVLRNKRVYGTRSRWFTSSNDRGFPLLIFVSKLWCLSENIHENCFFLFKTFIILVIGPGARVLPCAKCSLTMAIMKHSEVRIRFLANLKTRHSSTLLLTVLPASHKRGLRL